MDAMDVTAATERCLLAEGQALRGLARRLLHERGDPDDVVQETFAAALASHAAARGRLGPWLAGTVRHLVAMLHRADRRRRARERAAAQAECDAGDDPAAIAAQAELLRDVAEAVRALDEPFRTAIVLRFWHGVPPAGIARRLGVPRNTVRSRLQRGLERLRQALDSRHGDRQRWAAPLGGLAGVRQQSLAAAAGAVGTTVGMLMNTKLFLAGAAALVITLTLPFLCQRPGAASTPPTPGPAAAAAGGEAREPEHRARVAEPAANPSRAPSSALLPAPPPGPWVATLLVVDPAGEPVPDAVVTVWPAPNDAKAGMPEHVRPEPDPRHMARSSTKDGAQAPGSVAMLEAGERQRRPACIVRTDATGHVTVTLHDDVCTARATHEPEGESREKGVARERAEAETRLVLEPAILLLGHVREADGAPAPQVRVETRVVGGSGFERGMPATPGPVVTETVGAFTVRVQRDVRYELRATRTRDATFPFEVFVGDGPPAPITLVFPGAITLAGTVVDADARPVARADVTAWREFARGERDYSQAERVPVRADDAGRFSMPVRAHARYQLLATAPGHATSDLVWTETTQHEPHPEVRLVLQRLATIRGTVVHGDGSPFPGLSVRAHPEAGDSRNWIGQPWREDRFPAVEAATTGGDGRFTLSVHPRTDWTLDLRLAPRNWRLRVLEPGVRPGRDDVVLRVTENSCTAASCTAPSPGPTASRPRTITWTS